MSTERKVGIVRNAGSFLPEVDAYVSVLGGVPNLIVTEFDRFDQAEQVCDVVIAFAGLYPKYKYGNYAKVILDYNSLSVGRFAGLRDRIKRMVNVKADLFVALNEAVAARLRLPLDRTIIRPMGVAPRLLTLRGVADREEAAIYAGSIGREGVVSQILRVADSGLTVHVYGNTPEESQLFERHPHVRVWGRVSGAEVVERMGTVAYGINYTPDIFPYNMQDSTKVLEYCAAGLGVITNRYSWVDTFESSRDAAFMGIDQVSDIDSIRRFRFRTPDVQDLAWPTVIERSGLIQAVIDV